MAQRTFFKRTLTMLLLVSLLMPYLGMLPYVKETTTTSTAQAATGDNLTLMQYFEWYLPTDGNHWNKLAADAANLKNMGITGVWIPPAYKGGAGIYDVGYGSYDYYDLGEFNQKGTVRTKYGTKAQLQNAITQLHNNGVEVYLDVVMNHKGTADASETVNAIEIDWNDRNREISGAYPITAWTKFTFPGRGNTYSSFKWDASHFNGVDWDDKTKTSKLFKFQGRNWDWEVDTEKANFDYLMFADVDYDNQVVVQEMENWGVWVANELNLDGFRIDAVKHIKFDFMKNWLNNVRTRTGKSLFAVGEYWSGSTGALNNYLYKVGYNMNLFDVDLHYRFYSVGINNGNYDLRNLFGGTLGNTSMFNTVTFVDNHDSQPGQGLNSWVEPWFKPQSYAFIMTRREGIPTLFYGDYYGIPNNNIAPMKKQLDPILDARKTYAYGTQHDYLDHWDVVGWTREGEAARAKSGLATIISDGAAGNKWMYVGTQHSGEIWRDMTGNRSDTVSINADGWGNFQVNSKSVSIWIQGDAIAIDTTPPTVPADLAIASKTDTTVSLKWSPSSDQSGVASYDVFRDGTKVGSTTTTTYTDYSLNPSSSYSYAVRATDMKNNSSTQSSILSATTNALDGKLVTIYYKKGYANPFIHYRPAGGTWTVSPGLAMPASEITGYNKFIVSTGTAASIEACFNDGAAAWDNNGGLNYMFYGGTWTYTPGVNNAAGTIKAGDPNAVADTVAPTVPTNLSLVSKTDKTATISWTASTDNIGVGGYEVFRGQTMVGKSSTTSYTDIGLTAGQTYSYTVKAFDGSGNLSSASTALSVTTSTVAVNNSVTVYYKRGFSSPYIAYRPVGGTWTPTPLAMQSSEVSNYSKITVSIGEATAIEAVFFNGSTVWDNNDGKNYMFDMGTKTYTPGALSSPGTIIDGKPVDVSNPSKPSNLKSTAVSFSTITLGWSKSTDNKGVVAYDVFRDGKKVGFSTTNSFTDLKLTSGTRYAYRVAARDAAGNVSTATSTIYVNTTTIDIQPPTTPANLKASAVTTDTVSLSWLPSSDNDIVKGYDVYRNAVKLAFVDTPAYTDSGLMPATEYTYTVVALDAYPNFSAPSAPLNVMTLSIGSTDTTPPSVPTGLLVTDMMADGFTIAWTASTDADSGVKAYEVYDGTAKVATVTEPIYSFSALKEFSEHSITIKAVDLAGNVSAASAALIVKTSSNFSGINLNKNTVAENSSLNTVVGTLSGIGVATGQTVTYELVSGIDSDDNAQFNVSGNQLRTSAAFDFETKTDYKIRVRGTDAQGASVEQTFVVVVTDVDEVPPSAPTDLSASSITDSGFTLQWKASTDNVAVTGYQVFVDGNQLGASVTEQFVATGLTAATSYQVTVNSVDASGNVSASSTALIVKTSAPPPQNSVTIYYKRGYATPYIHYRPEGGAWTVAPGVAMQNSEYSGYSKITISIGTAAKLEACFNNGAGTWDSNNSLNYLFPNGVSTYTPSTVGGTGTITSGAPFVDNVAPSTPSSLNSSNVTFSGVSLSWTASTDNVAVQSYEVQQNGITIADVASPATSYSVVGLAGETKYTYQVRAKDSAGNTSAWSTSIEVTTPVAPPPKKVTIFYKKGFATPYIHYKPEGGNWTTAPGLAIPVSNITGYHQITLNIGQAAKLIAVFNDGLATWDNNGGLDYFFNEGTWTYVPGNNGTPGTIVSGAPTMDTIAPSAPTGLTSTQTAFNRVTLSWTAASDNVAVTGYEIYQNDKKVADVLGQSTTALVAGLTSETSYVFSVVALDEAGNRSTASESINVTTPVAPPTNKVTIYYKKGFDTPYVHYQPDGGTWTAAPGVAMQPSAIPGYQMIVIDIGYATKLTAVFNNGGTVWDNNNTLNYVFNVGDSTYHPGLNGAPGTIVNSAPILNKVTLYYKKGFNTPYIHYKPEGGAWTVPPGVAIPVSDIAGYNKIVIDIVNSNQITAAFTDGSGTTWDNNNGLDYVIAKGVWTYVPGVNGAAGVFTNGEPNPVDTIAPTIPTNLAVSNVTATTATLSWTASTDQVGVVEYEVFSYGSLVGTTTSPSFNVSGLTSGVIYSFTVRARDAANNRSDFSQSVQFGTPDVIAPSAPTNLSAVNVTSDSVSLSWSPANDNNAVVLYEVFRSGISLGTTTVTAYYVSGLSSGVSYSFTVKAKDAAGNISDASPATQVVTLDVVPPSAPTNLVSSNITTSGFKVTWSAATDNVAVTGYNVYRNGAYIATVTGTSYTFTGLTPSTTHSVTVMALDAAKNRSPLSSPLSVTTSSGAVADTSAPTVPTNLKASSITATGFTVTWTASTDNVGVTGYNVYRNGTYIATVTGTSYTFSGLTASTTYSITVLALDAAKNRSALSSPLSVTTPAVNLIDTTAPSAPTGLVSSNVTSTGFKVTWTTSTDNVGVTGYNVYRNGSYIATVTGTTYTFSGLTANTTYSITVLALDAAKNRSALSSPLSVTTLTVVAPTDTTAPTVPNGLSASNITKTGFRVNWTASTDNVGVTGYNIYRNGAYLASVTTLSYTFSGLLANTTYSITILAYDAAKNRSALSTPLSVKTLAN